MFPFVVDTQFQHTAARRRLEALCCDNQDGLLFQHTAARRRLAFLFGFNRLLGYGFNTQPPEGGWTTATSSNG